MNNNDYRGFAAEQTLLNCGFSPESISAITSTRIVNHNGQQVVMKESQLGLVQPSAPIQQSRPIDNLSIVNQRNPAENIITVSREQRDKSIQQSSLNETHIQMINSLNEQLTMQTQQFSRFKQYADGRIIHLESQMGDVLEKMKTALDIIQTLKSNSEAAKNREKLNQGSDKTPATQAIDRTGVAPADVSIDKIFYCGERR
jgi:hypothetical protein